MSRTKQSVEELFWAKVDIRGEDDCWEWKAKRHYRGYGSFSTTRKDTRKTLPAHRVSYTLTYGDPGKMLVCHKCDNRACCNPKHLFLGTHKDNMADMVRKGRQGRKLTAEDVREMRALFETGNFTTSQLATKYSCHVTNIQLILANKIWNLDGLPIKRFRAEKKSQKKSACPALPVAPLQIPIKTIPQARTGT